MATAADFEMMEHAKSLLSCPICMDEYSIPKVLPCQHTFCLDCLKRNLEAVNSQRIAPASNFPCPTCRKTCYIPGGGMERLPTDIKIGQIKEMLGMMDSTGRTSVIKPATSKENLSVKSSCVICSYQGNDSVAEHFCVQCMKLMCSKCRSRHVETNIFRCHDVYEISGSTGKVEESKSCKTHDNMECIYYCETCKAPLCTVCVLLPTHGKHAIVQLSESSSGASSVASRSGSVQGNNENLAESLEKMSRDVTGRIKTIGQLKQEHSKANQDSESAIKKSMKEAAKKLGEIQTTLLNDLKTSNERKHQELSTVEKKLLEKQNLIKKLQSELSKKSKNENVIQQKIAQELDPGQIPAVDLELYSCDVFHQDIRVQIGQLDEEFVEVSSTDAGNATSILRRPSGTVDATSRNTTQDKTVKSPPQRNSIEAVRKEAVLRTLIRTFSTRGMSKGHSKTGKVNDGGGSSSGSRLLLWKSDDFVSCRDCCFTDDNRLAATDHNSANGNWVKIFNAANGDKSNSFSSNEIADVWGICYDKGTHTLQTISQSNCCVKGLRSNGTKEDNLTKLSSTTKPSGIAITKSGEYVVSDASPDTGKILLYCPKMRKLTEFAEGELDRANYVVVDSNDRIIVSDSNSHYIKVFNCNGESLLRFSSCGPGGREMVPQGLAVDESNNIFVADQAIKAVSMFSKDGELIDNVVETMGVPWGISFHAGKKLLAVATDRGLEVYKL